MTIGVKQGILRQVRLAVMALGIMVLGTATASAVVVGDAAIDRGSADSFENFVIGLPGEVIPVNGSIGSWNVYADTAGELALLILSGTATAPTVQGVFQETASAGLNNFNLASSFGVQTGWFLGIWMGDGKVSFNNSSDDATFSSDGAHPTAPSVNDLLTLNEGIARDYSINTSVVPIPAALPLLATALVGLGLVGYRRRKAETA